MWWSRPDGERVRDLSPLRTLMPHLMPGRNQAAVYYEDTLDLGDTLPWLAAQEARGRKLTLFHVVVAACVRTLAQRPQICRFVVGRRLYQRKHLELSFAVKKALRDDAGMTAVKVRFQPDDTLDQILARIDGAIGTGRGHALTRSEHEMRLTHGLPGPLLAGLLWLQRLLDGLDLLPASLIEADPLYANLFLANMGSIGMPAVWHHLYEYGTIPLFGAVGRVHQAPRVLADGSLAVRDVAQVRWTFDERVTDGLYCFGTLELLRGYIEHPERLDVAPVVAAQAA
jgi:pyruvate/2-oxoglutarate dehydrogenase complex dihydrolipoamide acyltransferase (E2) component